MEYFMENDLLRVKVLSKGAELASVIDKKDNRELLWQADPAVWNRHAPILFPYCGKLANNTMLANGKEYPASQHGFARNMEFTCEEVYGMLVFTLEANDETRKFYPFQFTLTITFGLHGSKISQKVRVENTAPPGGEALPFTLGFHPGFRLPLTQGRTSSDYEFRFESDESPLVHLTPGGYTSGETRRLFENKRSISITDDIFANDSLCLSGLNSAAILLCEKNGGEDARAIRVEIIGFPYVLLWGPPKGPLPFVCIEPWHGLPDGPHPYGEFKNKPGQILLQPLQSWDTELSIKF